ncbi:MAG: type II secretion system minor pseudopilin GspI [Gammaproteobacteria bacterium]|nr:type II secretion system minor pseudopilin GspI [Gammaproteobacteria bacterium]
MTADGRRTGGFTLLEILVALTVVALALGAAISGTGSHVESTDHLRSKTIAHWVALNRIAELQVADPWPALGASSGTAQMTHREWRWAVEVNQTPDAGVRRLEVAVAPAASPEAVLARITAFTTARAGTAP